MRAHGNSPGPTQRPVSGGAVSALVASIPGGLVLWMSGALTSLEKTLSLKVWLVLMLYVLAMTLAGMVYGRLFGRAANDKRGGWLFGISFGFLLWMIGPVTALQLIRGQPAATGVAAMGLLGAHLIFGVALGLVFPWAHKLLQRKLGDLRWEHGQTGWYGTKHGLPIAQEENKR
jgi:hypothetical protein